eukprot:s3226_g14.t1
MDADFCPVSLQDDSPEKILEWLSIHRGRGPQRVRRLYRKSLLQAHVLGDALQLHKQLRDTLTQGGVQLASPSPGMPDTHDDLLDCVWCDRQFDTTQKLQAHLWTAHQVVSDERRFVFSDTCVACQTCFWTTARMQQHLRLSRRQPDGCYAQLTWRVAPLQEACSFAVPEDLRGQARLPAVTVASTFQSPAECGAASRADADEILRTAWNDAQYPEHLDPTLQRDVARFADECLVAWVPSTFALSQMRLCISWPRMLMMTMPSSGRYVFGLIDYLSIGVFLISLFQHFNDFVMILLACFWARHWDVCLHACMAMAHGSSVHSQFGRGAGLSSEKIKGS